MSWFKVDDGLHSHPKWLATPKAARALWVTAGSWCSDQLTDGFVPAQALRALDGTTREAAQLVTSGLWLEVEGGWLFHDWHDRNPSREQVEERRENNAERLRRWREKNTPNEKGTRRVRAV